MSLQAASSVVDYRGVAGSTTSQRWCCLPSTQAHLARFELSDRASFGSTSYWANGPPLNNSRAVLGQTLLPLEMW